MCKSMEVHAYSVIVETTKANSKIVNILISFYQCPEHLSYTIRIGATIGKFLQQNNCYLGVRCLSFLKPSYLSSLQFLWWAVLAPSVEP